MSNWDTYQSSDVLNLTGAYQVFKLSTADWITTLKPGELASIDIEYVLDTGTPSENLDVIIEVSGNGTKFESPGESQRQLISFQNAEADPQPVRNVAVPGVYSFRVLGRLRTPADAVGGTDTAQAYVHIRKDGVDAGSLP